jgi:hypothetical protein
MNFLHGSVAITFFSTYSNHIVLAEHLQFKIRPHEVSARNGERFELAFLSVVTAVIRTKLSSGCKPILQLRTFLCDATNSEPVLGISFLILTCPLLSLH